MDEQTITYGALGGLFLGGLVVFRFLWTIHTAVVAKHDTDDEKFASVYKTIDHKVGDLGKRIDRSKEECRENEKALRNEITELKIEIIRREDLDRMEKSIEGNVTKTVDTAIAQLKADLPQMMLEVLKTYKP